MDIEQIQQGLAELAADGIRRAEQQLDSSDCALSNWADSITRCKLLLEQGLLAAGGMAPFLAIQTIDGKPVNAKLIDGKFGLCWMLCDDAGKSIGKFLSCADSESEPGTPYVAKDRAMRRKGYRQVAVLKPAHVEVVGSGRGLSGTARAAIIADGSTQGSCAWLPSVID